MEKGLVVSKPGFLTEPDLRVALPSEEYSILQPLLLLVFLAFLCGCGVKWRCHSSKTILSLLRKKQKRHVSPDPVRYQVVAAPGGQLLTVYGEPYPLPPPLP